MKEKGFFVNLKSESSESLSYKIGLMVNELEIRTKSNKTVRRAKQNYAIDKPIKRALEKEEVDSKIRKWSKNRNLKVSKCLDIMKEYNWTISKQLWEKTMKDALLIKNSKLFLISLTKKPYERKWINSIGEQKTASDYGDVLLIKNNSVKLNEKYETLIKSLW